MKRVTVQSSDKRSNRSQCNRTLYLYLRRLYGLFKLHPLEQLVSIQHRPAYRYHLCHSAHRRIHQHHLCLRSTRDECRSDRHQLRLLRFNPLQLAQLQCTSHRHQRRTTADADADRYRTANWVFIRPTQYPSITFTL